MFSWTTPPRTARPGRPLVVAHRGSSGTAPENTLAAFRAGIAAGADAFELDVRLTRDGKAVVIHDRSLRRTTGRGGRVSQTESSVIRGLSAGAWFSPAFADEKVPFLEEVLELAGGRVGVNIELKFNSLREPPGPLVRKVCGIVRGMHRHDNILISSFHHRALSLQRSVAPEIGTGVLVYPPGVPTTSGVRLASRIGAAWLIYSGGNIRKTFVARARDEGFRTLEYTVDGKSRLKRAIGMGVDGVITNDPASVLAVLGAPGQSRVPTKTWV
jgi:glycerophosphoryl diester phosphodiesterase